MSATVADRIIFSSPRHGTYSTSPSELGRAMGEYLPAGTTMLRALVEGITGEDYGDVNDAVPLVIVLASIDEAHESS